MNNCTKAESLMIFLQCNQGSTSKTVKKPPINAKRCRDDVLDDVMPYDCWSVVAVILAGVLVAVRASQPKPQTEMQLTTFTSTFVLSESSQQTPVSFHLKTPPLSSSDTIPQPSKFTNKPGSPPGNNNQHSPKDGRDGNDPELPPPDLCPSFCDAGGLRHDRIRCNMLQPFCCKLIGDGRLIGFKCCDNDTDRADDDQQDDFNCNSRDSAGRWRQIALGVCVPVGSICFICIIFLCAYQNRVRLRRSLVVAKACCCVTSASTVGDSTSTRRPSVCSTAGHTSPTLSRHRETFTTDNEALSLDVVSSASPTDRTAIAGEAICLSVSPTQADLHLSTINRHHLQRLAAEVADGRTLDLTGVFFICVEPTQPPPYVDHDQPPSYTDLYPVNQT